MSHLKTLITAAIFLLVCAAPRTQNPADSCATLLRRLEELGKEQNLGAMVLLAMKAEHVCTKEFGAASLQYAEAVSFRGFAYMGTGRYREAQNLFLTERQVRIAAKAPFDDETYGNLQSNLGQTYMHLGSYDSARVHVDSALAIALNVFGRTHSSYANRLVNKGMVFFRQKNANLDSAEIYARQGLQILRNAGDSTFYFRSNALNTLGAVLREKGRYDEAVLLFDEAYQLSKAKYGETNLITAIMLGNKAVTIFENGGYLEAEMLMGRVIRYFEESNFTAHPVYHKILTNLSMTKGMLGKYDEATRLQEKAGRFPRSIGTVDSAEYFSARALVLQLTGNEAEAVDMFRKSAKMFENSEKKNFSTYLKVLSNLAVIYNALGNYEESAALLDKSVQVARQHWQKSNQQYAVLLHNTANNYFDLGRREEAEKLLTEAQTISNAADNENSILANIYYTAGYFKYQDGQFKHAKKLFAKSRRIWEETVAPENINYCKLLVSMAVLEYKTGHPRKAEKLFNRSVSLLEKGGNDDTEAYFYGLSEFANFQISRGKIRPAFALLQRTHRKFLDRIDANFTFLSEIGKERFLQKNEDNIQVYARFANNYAGHLPQSAGLAYDNELAVKGLLLSSVRSVATSIRNSGDSILIGQFQTWKTTKQLLAKQLSLPATERLVQKQMLDSLQLLADDAEVDLTIRSAAFQSARARVSWQQVRDNLAADEAAVEFTRFYYPGAADKVYYAALVLLPGALDPVFVPLFEENQLAGHLREAAEDAADYIEYVGLAYHGHETTTLYQLIWQPLTPLLGQVKTVWYAPMGLLHRIAFAAIAPETGQPLVKTYDLRLTGSTREVVFRRPLPGNAIHTALLIGGIEYAADSLCLAQAGRAQNFNATLLPVPELVVERGGCEMGPVPALPGTRKETDSLAAKLHKRMYVRLLQGCEAREEQIKKVGDPKAADTPPPGLIHVATHGFFCDDPIYAAGDKPVPGKLPLLRSGLLMAGSQRVRMGKMPFKNMEDGVLYASEIAELDLGGTKVVVLSACETALGTIRGGEGVYGLPLAFRLAGAEHVIMSLWQINDAETVLFMETLYRHWQAEIDIRAAFLAAQRELQAAGKGEELWGAFVLI
jgi:CHAT domain-containing protein/tetratricopeptide (TPR) repeat protein